MLQQCTALTLISLHSKPQRIYTSNLNERSNSRNFSPRRIQCGTSMCAPLVSIKSIFEYVNKVQLPDVCCLEYFAIFFEMMFCSHYLVIRQIFLCLVTISMTQTHSIINKLIVQIHCHYICIFVVYNWSFEAIINALVTSFVQVICITKYVETTTKSNKVRKFT